MAYVTHEDLVATYTTAELIRLTDRASPPGGVPDWDLIDRVVAEVDAVIDGYLRARYTLPLAVVDSGLRRIAATLVRGSLLGDALWEHSSRPGYDLAMKTLRDIGTGALILSGADTQHPAPLSGGAAVIAPGVVFSAGALGGYL